MMPLLCLTGKTHFLATKKFDNNSEDEDVPDGIILDLYQQEMQDLRSNQHGLDRFSCAEKVHIE
jgi:hypothetical protein